MQVQVPRRSQLKADIAELKQKMSSQHLQYEQAVTDMRNAIKARSNLLAEQTNMLNNFSNNFRKLQVQGGGEDRNKRGRGSRTKSPHLIPPENTRLKHMNMMASPTLKAENTQLKRMMASQRRRHEQTTSDLENAIKAKDSKITEQNDSLSYFSDTTRRLMTENNQLKQMMESQSLQFEHTIKDKDSEISDLNEMLNNFRKLQAPPPPRGTTCAICLEAPQTHVFIPCGHVCACQQCSKRVMDKKKKCPICNQRAKKTTELFFS